MKKSVLLMIMLLLTLSSCQNENEVIQPADKQSNSSIGPRVSTAASNAGGQL
jgi:hypothetical protein